MKFSHLTTYYLLRLLKKNFSSLKPSRRHNISIYLANKMFFSKRLRSEQAFKNIRRAFPTWPKEKILSTLKECYIFFTSNLIEFISTPKSWEGIEINVIGKKVLDEALKKTKELCSYLVTLVHGKYLGNGWENIRIYLLA